MEYIIDAVSSIVWKEKLLATTMGPKGISERNRRLLTSLYRSATGPFYVREAAAALSFTMPRTHRFLAYLAERGWLVRVCRGLYAPIPLDAIDPSLHGGKTPGSSRRSSSAPTTMLGGGRRASIGT